MVDTDEQTAVKDTVRRFVMLDAEESDLTWLENVIRQRRESAIWTLTPGDRVRFNHKTRPKYLVGREAVVARINQTTTTVYLEQGMGKFPAGAKFRVPNALLEAVK
jgi:hypothetical protein